MIYLFLVFQNTDRIQRRLDVGWRKINQTVEWLNPGPNKRDTLARLDEMFLRFVSLKYQKLRFECPACVSHHLLLASYDASDPQVYEQERFECEPVCSDDSFQF